MCCSRKDCPMMMFNLIAAPLGSRNMIARRGQDEIVFVVLIGPQGAAFGAEGAGGAVYSRRSFRYSELRGAAMATSTYGHRVCSPLERRGNAGAMSASGSWVSSKH
jgi:hypothetical protein